MAAGDGRRACNLWIRYIIDVGGMVMTAILTHAMSGDIDQALVAGPVLAEIFVNTYLCMIKSSSAVAHAYDAAGAGIAGSGAKAELSRHGRTLALPLQVMPASLCLPCAPRPRAGGQQWTAVMVHAAVPPQQYHSIKT